MTVPIEVIGQLIGEDLGLEFNDDLPSDFWNDFSPQDVPYIPVDGDYYVPTDMYGAIVDYLNSKDAFAEYEETDPTGQYGSIPFMVLPAGSYPSADGKNAIEARADIYIIATIQKKDGLTFTSDAYLLAAFVTVDVYSYREAVDAHGVGLAYAVRLLVFLYLYGSYGSLAAVHVGRVVQLLVCAEYLRQFLEAFSFERLSQFLVFRHFHHLVALYCALDVKACSSAHYRCLASADDVFVRFLEVALKLVQVVFLASLHDVYEMVSYLGSVLASVLVEVLACAYVHASVHLA
jgi:hypothetical protein